MITPLFLVGFSGHRHLTDPHAISFSLRECLDELRQKIAALGGALEFYGSIAYGADTLAVEAAREAGLPVHLILPKPVVRDAYVKERLRNPDIRIGQIAYFREKQGLAKPIFQKTLKWGGRMGRAALAFVLGAVLYKSWVIFAKILHFPYPASVSEASASPLSWAAVLFFSLLPIVLPLLAGIFIALRTTRDSGRRTFRYQEVAVRLTAAAALLETLDTEATVRRTVANTEEILLDELIEWHLAEQQNGAH